ncbi:sugar ABC transporter substrate-binding protein [Tepidibacillus sp. HK-1]|uniref:sugar ABC transporter substrate-binding protein n=1 Tax=Tepidibacillus sp. HK-1 TaxID=1883407 RepID=UPI000855F796|nr:substrate-binding domain-containing protein [Tepidibacillus sp. HK-1]GBF10360.1 D-xylose-binding periplasmic protein precursor [Tepidibacillus sp. HK-1]
MKKTSFLNIITISLLMILLVLIYLTVLTLISRSSDQSTNQGNDNEVEDKIKIGFSLGTLKEERWIRDRDILMAKVKELGQEIIVQNANNDDQDQLEQVKYLLDQGIDVLVIVPNDLKKAANAVELAKKAGVKVISYDRLVLNSDIDVYLSFNNVKVGELMAEYVLNKIQTGNILIINGAKSDHNTKMIKEGYDKILNPLVKNKRIQIINEEWAPNWMKEYAFKVVDNDLQKGRRIDAIIAGNDGLAEGAIEALSEYRMAGKIIVVGQDADLVASQRIVEGTQYMTVYKPIEKLADIAASLAIKLAKGENLEIEETIFNGKYDVPYYSLEPIAVTKDNIDETIIKDGFHLRNAVYRNLE